MSYYFYYVRDLKEILSNLFISVAFVSLPGKSTGGGRGSGICGDPAAAVSSKVSRLLSPKLPPPPPKKPKSLPPKPNPSLSIAGRRFKE